MSDSTNAEPAQNSNDSESELKSNAEQITSQQNSPPSHTFHGPFVGKILSLVGNTPLMPLHRLLEPYKYTCQVYAKCEFRNPSGTSWDRLVVSKIQEIQKSGQLTTGTHFVTGGNANLCTSLAWAGSSGNFPVTVLPGGSLVDESRNLLLKGFGANVILSFEQDPFRENTRACLKAHIKQLENTSGIFHHSILPFATEDSVKVYTKPFANEISAQFNALSDVDSNGGPPFDLIVCGGDNKNLVYGLYQSFKNSSGKSPIIVGVNFKENTFSEELEGKSEMDRIHNTIIWTTVTDAEAIDMTRRLIREEGLSVGHISGAVMTAAMRACNICGLATNPEAKVLVILGDSLMQVPSTDFLSTDWMVAKGHYNPNLLESLLWWYDMALENVNPPIVMTVPPDAPVNIVWKAMGRSLAERAVVVEKTEEGKMKTVVGVVTYDNLTDRMNSGYEERPVMDVCYSQFGVIDSKQSLADLEVLLRKFHWVVKIHRITFYGQDKENPQITEDIIGVINSADFMRYKRKIEAHHLREYGVRMSDGMPSEVWVEKFNKLPVSKIASLPAITEADEPAENGNQNSPEQ